MRNIREITVDEAYEIAKMFYRWIPEKEYYKDYLTKDNIVVFYSDIVNERGIILDFNESLELYIYNRNEFIKPDLTQSHLIINKLKEFGFDLSEFGI